MDTAAAVYVGTFVGFVGAGIGLFTGWKSICWKRAELANSYLRDFNSNAELLFAGRCLDWNGGKLVVPESLRPYLPKGESTIQHDRAIFAKALSPNLQLGDMDSDFRIQIYRTSMDQFLSWMSLVSNALERKLFEVADIEEIGYWVAKIESEVSLHPYIHAYGYESSISKLSKLIRTKSSNYQQWGFPPNFAFLAQTQDPKGSQKSKDSGE